MKQQLTAQLENKDKDPGSVFGDSVNYIMGNYHPRRKPMSMDDLARLNLDRSFAIFKERFQNAGAFQFTFVGNFTIDSIKVLVEKYIASLPATGLQENWKDIGIHYPAGPIDKVFHKGKENKASVRLYFTGDTPYSEMDDIQIGQLCKAMAIKLREVLREDAGGVYGVSVNGGLIREPYQAYSIGIQFGCAPENIDKLIGLVLTEIANTKNNGLASVNVDKVIAEQTRGLENEVKENSYWRYHLEQDFFRKANPLEILNAKERTKQFTVAGSKVLANRFFNEKAMIKLILLPEQK